MFFYFRYFLLTTTKDNVCAPKEFDSINLAPRVLSLLWVEKGPWERGCDSIRAHQNGRCDVISVLAYFFLSFSLPPFLSPFLSFRLSLFTNCLVQNSYGIFLFRLAGNGAVSAGKSIEMINPLFTRMIKGSNGGKVMALGEGLVESHNYVAFQIYAEWLQSVTGRRTF